MDVVNQIADAPTGAMDRPVNETKIESMRVDTLGVEYPEPEKM